MDFEYSRINVETFHIDSLGTVRFYLDGLLHKTDGPAVEYENGMKEWYLHGLRRRKNNEHTVELEDGTKIWTMGDAIHRMNGPAIIRPDGTKEWYYYNSLKKTEYPKFNWCRNGF